MDGRPLTDYSKPVACGVCGQHRPPGWDETHCVPCANTGHLYRLMGADEMAWCAKRDARAGYPEVARRRADIAETLRAVS